MKVLVATHTGQGGESGDYGFTVEGELVTPVAAACDDEQCGCDRGFPGLASSRATTTAMVAELPHVTHVELERALTDSLARGGWFQYLTPVEQQELVAEHVDAIRFIGEALDAGTVVRRQGDHVRAVPLRGGAR